MKRAIPLARERRSRLGAADRSSRHPIRSTVIVPRLRILAIAAALATVALVLVASGNSAVAASSLVNGNFETGDLTGWTVDTTASGGAANAVASYDYWFDAGPNACGWGPCWETQTMPPKEGSYFALLTSGRQQPKATRISQPFAASNGDKISGWAFFQTENYFDSCTVPVDDKGQVVIRSDSGTTVATPFEQNITTAPSAQYGGNSGWKYWEYTFTGLTGTGQFQIEARVNTGAASIGPFGTDLNRMGLDDVKTSTGGPDTTPPETNITSGYGYVSPGVGCITPSTSATFEFSSNEPGSTFKCQLSKDGAVVQAWAACTSPKSYSNLSSDQAYEATYEFEVQATDPAGNVDPTPAARYWFIERDSTAPTVSSVSPASGATNVARSTDVGATFSEDMDSSKLTTSTFTLTKKGNTTVIPATVSYDAATKKAMLDPNSDLEANTTYTATISTGAKDLAGNALAHNYTWSFTTVAPPPDTTAPTVSTVSPADQTKGVGRATDVTAKFSEDLNPATLTTSTFTLVKSGSTQPISATVSYDPASLTATLDPYGTSSTTLSRCTWYKATLTTGIKDKAGNALAAPKVWQFQTKGC